MSQVSEIVVRWTPEVSGRVASIQIQSRIAGQEEWTEQAAAFDAEVGEFRFTANAPSTKVEVRARYRNTDGIFGAWLGSDIITASAVVEYDTITGRPTKLGDVNPVEGNKLGSVEPGATVGGTVGVNVKNPDGTVYVPIVPGDIDREIAEIKTAIDADIASAKQSASDARTEAEQARSDAAAASAEAAQVRTDLVPTIAEARKAGTDASAEAATVRDILSAEVSRAKGEEGTLSTRIATAQGRADGAHTAISEETTQRANADTALSNRASTVEAKLAGTVDSELAARIRAEETARVAADNAVAARTSVVEASYGRVADVIDNGHFDAGFDGWVRFGASIVVPSSYGRSNVVRTVKGARLDSIWGRRYTVKSRDQRFKLSASLRCAESTSRYYAGAVFFDADGNHVAANDGTGNYPLGSGYDLNAANHGWLDRSVIIGQGLGYYSDFGGSCGIPDAAKYFRPILFINYLDDPNSVTEVDYFTVEDVTENVATNARLTIEETARSTADTALANRLTTTEAKLSGSQDSELAARIRSEETARVATDNALATRNTTLEAKFNSSSDRKAMTVGPDTFVAVSLGDPATLANGGVYGSTTAYGPHVEFTSAAASLRAVATLGRANHTYKLRARLWQTGGAPTYALWYADYLDGNYNRVGTALIGDWYSIANYFLQTIEREWTSTFIEGAVYIRFSVLVNRLPANPGPETVPGATTRVLEASVENVSSLRATDAVTNARITAEETARTNADSAIANRTSALEVQMNDQSDSWLRARIREEATARADGDNAIANRASVLESQMSGTQPSGLQTLVKDNRKNLADVGWWKKGASIPWGLNGGQQNEIISFPDGTDWGGGKVSGPDGQSADVWYCRADAGGDSAGGWNNGTIAPLDPDKTYRFIVPIVQLGSAGARTAYWGTGGVCDLNTSNPNGNPYFGFHGNMTPNRWRLFVGYIFPRNSTGRTHDGAGVFDMLTGELVSQGWNYCFRPDGAQPIHRAYQYYSYSGSYQAFGRPLVELVDGSETPFPSLSPALRTANARITLEETTRANADSALASRASALEAQMNDTSDSWLRARIREEATARANADSALANRASSLETNFSRIPETWRVRAHGNGAQRPAGFGEVGVFAPNGSSQGGYSRSYTVVWFQDGANIVDGVRAFDTYGDGQIKYNGGGAGDNDSGAMARCLNAIPQGRTVIVYSADEPSINRRGNGLTEAMRRCGAGPVFESDQFKLHSAYILIGKAGAGQGNGTEYYAGSYDTDLMAWLDITFTLTNGRATIGNQAGVAVTAAKIAAEETTRANADNAIANRVATTEAQFRREIASPLNTTVDSLVNANDYRYREIIQANTRITNEETTRANADSALGNRISTVEASYVTQSQLRVADMDLHFDANIPANDAWAPSVYGTGTLDGRITKTVAWNSISCLYWGVQGGAEVYSRKTIPVDPSRKYRMKARFGAYNTGSTGNGDRFYIGFVGIDAYGNILDHSPNGTYRYAVCPGEVIVDGNIVERSVVVTGEGNDSLLKFPPGTRQIRLLVFMNYDGRAVSSYVDYFTIEEITEVDARVSEEATARANADSALASRTNLLEGQISGANDSYVLARLRNEETARANADSALVSRTNALEAQMNDQSDSWLRARIREEASARADADSALSTRSTNLETRAGNVESRVTTTEGAISNLNGRSAAYWQVEAVAGGRARLRAYADNYGSAIDIAADQVYLGNKRTLAIENDRATITGDLYAGNGRIIMDNGTVMKVAGTGFGSANQFIEWFGPRQTNLANCTEANATYYLKTNGSAYFGGALSAGVIKNSVQTTALIGTANVTTGTFGSNGGSRVITVGYTGTGQESVSGACPAYYTPYVRIRLYRGTDANGALLAEQQINGSHECEPATRSGATTEPGFLTDQIGGSFTYTDNGGGTSVGYFVQIVARELRGALSQSLSLTSVEG